jgi:hypothetical protein
MKTTSHLACDFRQNKITFLDVLFFRGNARAFVLVHETAPKQWNTVIWVEPICGRGTR